MVTKQFEIQAKSRVVSKFNELFYYVITTNKSEEIYYVSSDDIECLVRDSLIQFTSTEETIPVQLDKENNLVYNNVSLPLLTYKDIVSKTDLSLLQETDVQLKLLMYRINIPNKDLTKVVVKFAPLEDNVPYQITNKEGYEYLYINNKYRYNLYTKNIEMLLAHYLNTNTQNIVLPNFKQSIKNGIIKPILLGDVAPFFEQCLVRGTVHFHTCKKEPLCNAFIYFSTKEKENANCGVCGSKSLYNVGESIEKYEFFNLIEEYEKQQRYSKGYYYVSNVIYLMQEIYNKIRRTPYIRYIEKIDDTKR